MRKRILFVNEANYLSTGYSVYGYELLRRLHATGKYDIAELGVYGQDDDPRWRNTPWKFFPNQPCEPNEVAAYNSRLSNHFGEWRFERACLEFKPHIVCDIRDHWMVEHQERSPFRPFFKWVLMPTVDSAPIHKQWMASYISADAILAYSEFGREHLSKQGGSLIKFKSIASPGANPEHFPYIADKVAHKKSLGMPEDIFVVGTVMRNQERKLYPDLIQAFADFLKQAPPEIARKTYLYMHTAYPDVGWEIPELVIEAGIANKCIFTYNCQVCGVSYPSFYQDVRTFCRNCKQYMASLPNVKAGSSRAALGQIMNCFDVYVQYAICEGFGMPLVEAGACGSILFGVDYSAIADIIKTVGGIPIKVQRMNRDPKTYALRALPDNQDLVNKLIEVLQWEPEYRLSKAEGIKNAVVKNYSWDNTAKVWEDCLDNIEVTPDEQSWKLPSRGGQPNKHPPEGLTNDQFVQWAIVNTARRPELLDSYIAMRIVRDLNWGIWQSTPAGIYFNDASYAGLQPVWSEYGREQVMQEMLRACEQKNYWESERMKTI